MTEQSKPLRARFKGKILGLLIVVIAIGLFVFLKSTKPQQPAVEVQEKIWPIKTLSAGLDTLQPVYTLYGTVESRSMVTAAAPVPGVIDSVPVRAGDNIETGQLMVALSEADIELPYQVALADVADTQAQLELQDLNYKANQEKLKQEQNVLRLKQQDVKRNRDLIRRELISQAQLDQSIEALNRQEFTVIGAELLVEQNKVQVEQLKARLAKAQASLRQAEINRERGIVEVPYPARVSEVHVAAGDRVGVNTPLVSYYPLDSLELRSQIPVAQMSMVYRALQDGERLQAIYLVDDQRYRLDLERLAGTSSTSGVDAFFSLPAKLSILRPGDLMKIQLLGHAISNTLAVPYSALYGSDRIYRVIDNSLQAVSVELLGDTLVDGQPWALIRGDLPPRSEISITHLPNAITGLKVTVVESR